MEKKYRPWIRTLSGLCVNISAAWFAIAFITPNFANLSTTDTLFALTRYILSAIVFYIAAALLERTLNE